MRTVLSIPVLILLATLCATAAAARRPALSWGKPGVSYDEYRADATSCLREAAGTDLAGTEPANALVFATRQIDTIATRDFAPMVGADPMTPIYNAVNAMQRAKMMARPDLRIRQARDILQERLDHCLQEHGYSRFQLTDEQRRRRDHFDSRQTERQLYLYSLASDPQVLASQAVAADISSRR